VECREWLEAIRSRGTPAQVGAAIASNGKNDYEGGNKSHTDAEPSLVALNKAVHQIEDSHIHHEEGILGIDSIACSLTQRESHDSSTYPSYSSRHGKPKHKRKGENHAKVQKSAICGDVSPSPRLQYLPIEIESRNREEMAMK
jgi:hypothetical protein